ncbi:MAG TPA: serine protease [Sandaracinaceae bacterium LLY-WYZ-13_1]|nr:serine protease [Sandaracinaceae bacterium LLY-WYZ-13_1]
MARRRGTPRLRGARHAAAILLLALVAVACAEAPTNVAGRRAPVVYGEDGRTEVHAHPSAALRAVAETAVAVKIDADWLDASDPSAVRITYTRTLGEAKDLCPGERFADQIEPGTCSGTLIDERYLLTAGHCMDAPDDCRDDRWVFGFRYAAEGELATLSRDDVYACARVLAYFDDGDVDHAVVELDRPVVGHTPAPVRVDPAGLDVGTPVALIGHPNGLPMKIDDGGEVTWSSVDATYLNATVDAFDGNSGSGVFDADGNLVALLRGGMDDYVDAGGCQVVNVLDPPPTDDGEELTYVRPALDALCATPGVDSALCDCDGPCVPAPPGDRCDDATAIEAVSQVLEGTLDGYAPTTEGSCAGAGRDRAWAFTVDAPVRFTARSEGFDTVLHLRDGCEGAELACNDDVDRDTDRGSRIVRRLDPGPHVLFLDAYGTDVGAFTLTLTFEEGAPDAGPPPDPDPDAGPPPAPDAGVALADAGRPAEPMDEGCGCRAVGRSPRSPESAVPPALLLAGLAIALVRRRRGPRPAARR